MSTLNPKSGICASKSLENEAIERSNNKQCIEKGEFLNFAYTDYGGDFLDIVFIDYFLSHYPENIVVENTVYCGRNAIVFNTEKEPDLIDRFTSETEDYILGFEDVGEFHSEKEREAFLAFVEFFIEQELIGEFIFDREKVNDWLHNDRYGYFPITTQGIEYDTRQLIDDLLNVGLIKNNKNQM